MELPLNIRIRESFLVLLVEPVKPHRQDCGESIEMLLLLMETARFYGKRTMKCLCMEVRGVEPQESLLTGKFH